LKEVIMSVASKDFDLEVLAAATKEQLEKGQ
jgi:hypothetical protein